MNKKRGQTQISFGMIFSIILIVVFIAFAIYGITKFLGVQKFAQVEKFKNDFQADINNMWKSTQGSQDVEYFIPKKIEQVCFAEGEFYNMYFIPSDYDGYILKNIDFAKINILSGKKLCISTLNGKISMTIKKNYNENLVTITK
jgi:hypothetical protein